MEQDAILKKIIKDAKQFNTEKQILKKDNEKLIEQQNEIKAIIAEANQLKGKDETAFKEKLEEAKKIAKEREVLYYKEEKNEKELKEKIEKEKKKIISDLKKKQEKIFNNRHKNIENLNGGDIYKLKQEKEKLQEEIKLAKTPKDKLEKMSDEEKNKVKEATKKLKGNKNRVKEINDIMDTSKILEGQKPLEKFRELNVIMKNVEEKFNFDKIDMMLFDALAQKKDKENEKAGLKPETKTNTATKPKQTTPPQNNPNPVTQTPPPQSPSQQPSQAQQGTPPQQQSQIDMSFVNMVQRKFKENNIGNITILEKEGKVIYDLGDKKGEISLKEINEDKRAMFRRLEIRKRVKGFGTLRKVNPAVIKALDQLENSDEAIEQYLGSLKNNDIFNFKLNHDLTGLNPIQKMRKNRQVKSEQICGANVLGRLFHKNNEKLIGTPDIKIVNAQEKSTTQQKLSEKDYIKADKETLDKVDKVIEGARKAMGADVKEIKTEEKLRDSEETEVTH